MKAEFFYADDGLVDSIDLGWIHSMFDMLTGIFNWVGMRTNVRNTMGMVCNPCQAAGVWAEKAFTRLMTREGQGFKER